MPTESNPCSREDDFWELVLPEPAIQRNRPDVDTPSGGSAPAPDRRGRLRRQMDHVHTKLTLLLVVLLTLTLALIGYISVRVHRSELQQATQTSSANTADVIRRSTSYFMMQNDRDGLHQMIQTIADQPGIVRIRVISPTGQVSYSSDAREIGTIIDKHSAECTACHKNGASLPTPGGDRFRIFHAGGQRVLGTITAIDNDPTCSNAACHAHPASQRVLGVLDTQVSLAAADRSLASATLTLTAQTITGIVFVVLVIWLVVQHFVHRPLAKLRTGTEHLAKGELGYQIRVKSQFDEVGQLAASFNRMSSELLAARREVTDWAHTLEERVAQKTSELQQAQEQMLRVERMVAIGKLAAVVAHEINNPLAGILTYAKLIRRWLERGITTEERKKEACDSLDLIASESRRCGELVKNLLMFSRKTPMNIEKNDLNSILERSLLLVQHKAEIQAVNVVTDLERALPAILCDAAQIEQVVLALILNALDAMPHGGNLWVSTRRLGPDVEIQVRDDGSGIPPEIMPRIFEPFTTTKEVGKGTGLGLAIAKGITERHGGRIELQSELGVGTTFRVFIPVEGKIPEAQPAVLTAAP